MRQSSLILMPMLRLPDADAEVIATPEFWGNLIDESFPDPANESAAVDPPAVRALTRSPACEDLEDLQNLGQPSSNGAQLIAKY